MPTTELGPTAQGNYNQYLLGAGANKWVACQRPDDEDATHIYDPANAPPQRDSFIMENLPGAAGVVTAVIHNMRSTIRGAGAPKIKHLIRYGGVDGLGTERTPGGAYGEWVHDFAAALPGGGSYTTPAQVNTTEAGLEKTSLAADRAKTTTIELDVTWIPGGGEFPYLVTQWLPPLLAVASHALMKSEIVKILSNLKTRPSDDEDFAWILEAFRVRPKFSGPLAPCASLPRGPLVALPGAP